MGHSLPQGRAISPVVRSARVVPVQMLPVDLAQARRAMRVDPRRVDLGLRRAIPPVDDRAALHPVWGRAPRGRGIRLVDNSLRVRGHNSPGVGQGSRRVVRDRARDSRAMRPAHSNFRVGPATHLVHNSIRARVDHGPGLRSVGQAR
ncbi:hypothetical protein [Nocardia sp. XZ_19_231]|uniref:hypothetical protein n=1 Tax=Nocardia sp. XZ_19_231 TaxID=2769252 RepID=UPI0018907A8A|nr:hypothetical protein [Nocardia sp. XZ_19_231]